MNRNRLKAYAPRARRDFIKAVTDRAAVYGLTKKGTEPVVAQGDVGIIGGKPFSRDVVEKRKRLVERIEREGFDQVMEAMAYTWFNRFVAIRFMEVHGYLDHGYKVLGTTNDTPVEHPKGGPGSTGRANSTNERNLGLPEILLYAEHVELPGVDRERVVELKLAGNRDEELYRLLLVGQCNALHQAMPFLFERIGDATELLLPENLLHSDSLIRRMVNEVPEEEWQEVEILGWLYQFYISEKKDQVIGKVVKSEDIPAATQLFTPNWIVKYMVQNTIGRMWLATYPDSPLRKLMEYYIEPGEQTPEVMEQIRAMTPESLNPEEMTLADVACGSGHILVEGYDLFKAIYQERGYRAKDIPRLILEKNLYGLDIDDRAAQLAAFALMMKARADDRRIFERGVKLNVMAIQNSPKLDDAALEVFLTTPVEHPEREPGSTGQANNTPVEHPGREPGSTGQANNTNGGEKVGSVGVGDLRGLLELFEHGKTFGSLIRVPEELRAKLPVVAERVENVLARGEMFSRATAEAISPIVQQARILAGPYEASVTNPPYMGSGAMAPELKRFAKDQYPDRKSDLFAMFIERNLELLKRYGQTGMITMQSWMFLSSFEKLREKLVDQYTILSMAHLGPRAFDSIGGEVVSTTTFVIGDGFSARYKAAYVRLVDGGSEAEKDRYFRQALRENKRGFYISAMNQLKNIPGSPIAYWVSERVSKIFEKSVALGEVASPRIGMRTGDNSKYLRLWHETSLLNMSLPSMKYRSDRGPKWFPYNKGGSFRKWYGNYEYIVNWENDGFEIKENTLVNYPQLSWDNLGWKISNETFYFREGVTWTDLSTSHFGVRYLPNGFIFDAAGPCLFGQKPLLYLSFLVTKQCFEFLKMLNPTLHFKNYNIAALPFTDTGLNTVIVEEIASTAIEITKKDWDSYETSWDFSGIPLLLLGCDSQTLESDFVTLLSNWQRVCLEMQRLEEENNRIFIEAYGLQDELTPDVPLSEITLTCNPHYRYGPSKSEEGLEELLRADTMKELVSYAVGCMMGRYSLDAPGLIYAHRGNEAFWETYTHKTDKHTSNSSLRSLRLCGEFLPDEDGIIPITDTDWFPDDAANRFFLFISVAWPKEHLEENLAFIADSLSPNRGESPRETIRHYIATGFFKHHLKMYKKRPIYWLFSSGKFRAFQCLVYLHRYNEGTLSRMRTEYVIPLQGKFAARIEQLSGDMDAATSTAHRKRLEKERSNLVKQQAELQAFDEKLRHYADMRISLDLDDGVKVNYGKFGDLLAEVQAITGEK